MSVIQQFDLHVRSLVLTLCSFSPPTYLYYNLAIDRILNLSVTDLITIPSSHSPIDHF